MPFSGLPGATEASVDTRLEALRRYSSPDAPDEEALDRLTRHAADLFNAPIALLSFVGAERQWFKSAVGLGRREMDLDGSFCAATIEAEGPTVVDNATADPRFAENPLVTGAPGVRFYAGAPLVTEGGHRIGTLSVMDDEPRQMGAAERERLATLAQMAMDYLEQRRAAHVREERLRERRRQFEAVLDDPNVLAGLMAPDGTLLEANDAALARIDASREEVLGQPLWETPWWPDRLREDVRTWVRQAAAGEHVERQVDLSRADGTLPSFHVEGTIRPVSGEDGTVKGLIVSARDVTDREEREEALRRQHDLQRRVFETSPAGIVLIGEDGYIYDLNEQAETTLGATREELIGRAYNDPAWEITAPDGSPMPDEELPFPRVMEKDETVRGAEHAIEDSEGRRRILRVGGAPLQAAPDGRGGAVFVVEDVTERKEREEALRESRARYRTLAEHFPNGLVALFDEDLRYRLVRGRVPDDDAPSPEEVEGRRVSDIFGAETASQLMPHYQAALDGEPSTAEVSFRGRLYRVRTVPVSEDPPRGLAMTQDITDQEEDRRQLETLVGNLPGFAYRHRNEPGWPLVFIKGQVKDVLGYTAQEMKEDVEWAEEVIHPEDRDYVRRASEEGRTQSGQYDLTYRVLTKEGKERWVRERGQRAEDPATGEELFDGFITDVTERKEAARELERQKTVFQALVEHLPAGVVVESDDRSVQAANDAFCEIFGLRASPEDLVGRDCAAMAEATKDLFAAPDRFVQSIEQALENRETRRDEFETADGRLLTRDYVPYDYPHGTAHLWVYRDVSGERERERLLSGLFEDALYGIGVKDIVTDDEGRPVDFVYRDVNAAFEEVTGLAADEVLGRRATEVIDGIEDTPFIETFGQVGLEGTSAKFEEYSEPLGRHYEISAFSPRRGRCVTLFSDITERKEREQELATARERVELALEATGSIVFEIHLASDMITRYGPTARVIGIDSDQISSPDAYVEKVVHPDDRADFQQFLRSFRQGERDVGELTYRSVAGDETRWIRDQAYAYEDDDTRRIVGLSQDVTERREAERALRASERQIRGIAGSVPGVLFQFCAQPDGTRALRYVSEQAEDYGLDPSAENLFEWVVGLVPESHREAFLTSIEQAVAQETLWDHEFPLETPNGERKWLHAVSHPERSDGELIFNGLLLDITERKTAERELDKRERFLRSITESVTDGIFQSSREEGLRYANQALADMFGYESPEALLEVDPSDLYADPSERQRLFEQLLEEGDFTGEEVRYRRKDGSVLIGRVSTTLVYDEDGEPRYHNGVMVDITDRKEREEALRAAKEEAEAAARFKESMLANLSHEIRTPLSPIIGYAELLRGTLEDEASEFAEHIYESGRRLNRTLEAMLSLSKLEGGAYELSPERIHFGELAEEVADLLRRPAIEDGVELRVDASDDAEARLDAEGCRHVLRNLTENAIKFTPEGGNVWIRAYLEGDESILEVEDTGIGISEDVREEIFEPFKQESEGTSRKYEGTGLGLSIVREFVELMDGTINLESEKGKGTRITVRLPRQ